MHDASLMTYDVNLNASLSKDDKMKCKMVVLGGRLGREGMADFLSLTFPTKIKTSAKSENSARVETRGAVFQLFSRMRS